MSKKSTEVVGGKVVKVKIVDDEFVDDKSIDDETEGDETESNVTESNVTESDETEGDDVTDDEESKESFTVNKIMEDLKKKKDELDELTKRLEACMKKSQQKPNTSKVQQNKQASGVPKELIIPKIHSKQQEVTSTKQKESKPTKIHENMPIKQKKPGNMPTKQEKIPDITSPDWDFLTKPEGCPEGKCIFCWKNEKTNGHSFCSPGCAVAYSTGKHYYATTFGCIICGKKNIGVGTSFCSRECAYLHKEKTCTVATTALTTVRRPFSTKEKKQNGGSSTIHPVLSSRPMRSHETSAPQMISSSTAPVNKSVQDNKSVQIDKSAQDEKSVQDNKSVQIDKSAQDEKNKPRTIRFVQIENSDGGCDEQTEDLKPLKQSIEYMMKNCMNPVLLESRFGMIQ
jgi:hypothetical protein